MGKSPCLIGKWPFSIVFCRFTRGYALEDPPLMESWLPEVGYMVFIGDFVPAILALLFPSQEWAKISNGSLGAFEVGINSFFGLDVCHPGWQTGNHCHFPQIRCCYHVLPLVQNFSWFLKVHFSRFQPQDPPKNDGVFHGVRGDPRHRIGSWSMIFLAMLLAHGILTRKVTGWWFGCHEFYFPINIGLISSSQLTNSFFSEG